MVGEDDDAQAALPGRADVLGHGADRVVGEGRVDVVILVEGDQAADREAAGGGTPGGCAHAATFCTSLRSMKRSSRNRTMATSRKSTWSGTGRPRSASSASRGMFTPLAMVSGSAPGARGFTSSKDARPATSRRACTLEM